MPKAEHSPNAAHALILLVHYEVDVAQLLGDSKQQALVLPAFDARGQPAGTHLMAAYIPAYPAPITLTFSGRRFSTGASFSLYPPSTAAPVSPAIARIYRRFSHLHVLCR